MEAQSNEQNRMGVSLQGDQGSLRAVHRGVVVKVTIFIIRLKLSKLPYSHVYIKITISFEYLNDYFYQIPE